MRNRMIIKNSITIKSKNFTQADRLIVFLHGYGSCGADFEEIATKIAKPLTNTVVFVPDAPFECDLSFSGKEWFSLSEETLLQDIENGQALVAPILKNYIEELKKKYECKNINLIGFSQGAILSLAMCYYIDISKIVAFSGLLHAPCDAKIVSKNVKILLVHGDMDDVVPFENTIHTMESFKKLGIETRLMRCHGIGHTISNDAISPCVEFLNK